MIIRLRKDVYRLFVIAVPNSGEVAAANAGAITEAVTTPFHTLHGIRIAVEYIVELSTLYDTDKRSTTSSLTRVCGSSCRE